MVQVEGNKAFSKWSSPWFFKCVVQRVSRSVCHSTKFPSIPKIYERRHIDSLDDKCLKLLEFASATISTRHIWWRRLLSTWNLPTEYCATSAIQTLPYRNLLYVLSLFSLFHMETLFEYDRYSVRIFHRLWELPVLNQCRLPCRFLLNYHYVHFTFHSPTLRQLSY